VSLIGLTFLKMDHITMLIWLACRTLIIVIDSRVLLVACGFALFACCRRGRSCVEALAVLSSRYRYFTLLSGGKVETFFSVSDACTTVSHNLGCGGGAAAANTSVWPLWHRIPTVQAVSRDAASRCLRISFHAQHVGRVDSPRRNSFGSCG